MRYFIEFTYRGTDFHGSQTQPNGETVQSEMEQAFATILQDRVPLVFAGRTDAGVHAKMMVAHFDYTPVLPSKMVSRLNALLPDSIAVRSIRPVYNDAHARFDALSRTYHYHITTKKHPFLYITHARVGEGLDFEAMNRAADLLIGKQDFASFCRAHTDAKTTICDVREAKWVQVSETEAYFTITANRFLRNMVRAIVGTLFAVGRGKMTSGDLAEIIFLRNRCRAGQSAPAEGLSLVEITYPNNIYL
jgi:tRNA pseudouridine38-40 synthase